MIEIYNEKENFQTDPNIPEVNKVIDDDMNQLRNAVLKGTYYDETNNVLKAQNGTELDPKIPRYENLRIYLTEEQVVGKWIDGRTLYRTVAVFGTFPNDTQVSFNHNISNIKEVCFYIYGWYDTEDSRWYCGSRVDSSSVICKVAVGLSDVRIQGLGTNWTTRTSGGHCDIYYTKTTD